MKQKNKFYLSLVLLVVLLCALSVTAFATGTGGDPLTVINKLSDFIFGLIRAVGMILLGWGIVQVGLSLQSHDPGGGHYHHLYKGDPDPHYRLTVQK